ncbi:hypothetical protein NQ318_022020 [Aromia moschata]|uniref:Membrane protein BRI3 n=1 Tax=Aromia moschata TaxID=1265417 RepID=A0AAV8Z748_9CUCU|nr:hypothetical protein NQ318_022020 [Aromia moschata]
MIRPETERLFTVDDGRAKVVVVNNTPVGGCPVCHNGSWTGTYSCCAWLLAIFCFPCGILCCCCMRKKKCTKCGYTVG